MATPEVMHIYCVYVLECQEIFLWSEYEPEAEQFALTTCGASDAPPMITVVGTRLKNLQQLPAHDPETSLGRKPDYRLR